MTTRRPTETLLLAFDPGNTTWTLGFGRAGAAVPPRVRTIRARDLTRECTCVVNRTSNGTTIRAYDDETPRFAGSSPPRPFPRQSAPAARSRRQTHASPWTGRNT